MFKSATPVLRVSSAAVAEKFYCQQLGFQLQSTNRLSESQTDPCYLSVRRDEARLHLSSFSGDGAMGSVAFLLVEDVDALYAELMAKGVPIALTPTDQTWGNRELYVKDADGNSLRFIQMAAL
jgi:uncharacterized glyoxalase superfamily protein PhnB